MSHSCPGNQKALPALLALAVFLLAGAALGQSQSQAPPPPPPSPQKQESAADAARKAKAEKAKSPRKVYTEEDLSGLKPGSVSVVGQETPAADSSPQDRDADATKSGKTEEYWRGRARKLRDQMAATDQEIAKLKDEIKKTGGGGFDASTGLKQNVIYIHDSNARLQKLEQQKEKLEKQMDLLQEEGRRAGALPEWFR